jgi:hypothetical protein
MREDDESQSIAPPAHSRADWYHRRVRGRSRQPNSPNDVWLQSSLGNTAPIAIQRAPAAPQHEASPKADDDTGDVTHEHIEAYTSSPGCGRHASVPRVAWHGEVPTCR